MDKNNFSINTAKLFIVGIGEILWDIYDENTKYLGGAPANFSIHCAQLGNNGAIVSRIGKDELGQQITKELIDRNISKDHLQTDPKIETGTVRVKLDEKGKPQFKCTSNVAFDYLQVEDNLMELSAHADGILFGTLAQRNETARKTIINFLEKAKNVFKIYDVNLRGWNDETEQIVKSSLELCNAIKSNDSELAILKNAWQPKLENKSFMDYLFVKYQLKLVALTLGEKGCILMNKNTIVETEGINISPVDTTGCGDAFAAGLMHQHLSGKPLQEISEFSNALGAFVAKFPGATPDYSLRDLENFQLSQHQKTIIKKR